MPPIVIGSPALFCTSSCVCWNSVPTPNAPAMPIARPSPIYTIDLRRNSHDTSLLCAPSAMRMPISCVRCDTAYAVTA